MRIIISPAKNMKENDDYVAAVGTSVYLEQAFEILQYLKGLSYPEAKKLWATSDKIAQENFERLKDMDLNQGRTPAILAYDGIAYKYMAPNVFENGEFDYVQENLRILSGLYGVLKPLDGVTPYRLEMQAKAKIAGCKDLYDYWGDSIYNAVMDESKVVINLASKEYSKCIEKYLRPEDRCITCIFGEIAGEKIVQKGVYAKMARGEMVRYMALHQVKTPEGLKGFDHLGYAYCEERSDDTSYVFIKDSGHVI